MSQFLKKGGYKSGHLNHSYTVQVWTYFDEEEKVFYAVCPELDIIGGGSSESEALGSFETSIAEFVKYVCNKRTVADVLIGLGWDVHKKGRSEFSAKSPRLSELLVNPAWSQILEKKPTVQARHVQLALS